MHALQGTITVAAGATVVAGSTASEPCTTEIPRRGRGSTDTASLRARMAEPSCGHWNEPVCPAVEHVVVVASHVPTAPQYLHEPPTYSGVSFTILSSQS